MVNPLSLMNMEMQLYGGMSTNSLAPSYANNYCCQSNYLNSNYGTYTQNLGYNNTSYNPSFTGYNYPTYSYNNQNGMSFGQNIPQNYAQALTSQETEQQACATPFEGLSKVESQAIVDYYAKNLEPSQGIVAAGTSGVLFGAMMMNPRILAHPINYLTTTFNPNSKVNQLFNFKNNSALKTAWEKNSVIFEEAYSQMHRAEARSKWKVGAFRKRYTKAEIETLENLMKDALKPGANGKIDVKKVAEATEKLRHAYTTNGWLAIGKNGTVAKQLDMSIKANAETIAKNTDKLYGFRNSEMTWKKAFQKSGGKMGLMFAGVEMLMNAGKIQTAFKEDKKTGYKQLGQTTVKALANAGGWMLGETIGIKAAAKFGAKLGSKVHPILGTAIGAIAGLLGGSIGMCLGGKAAKKLVGEDVANKIEARNLAKSAEGQLQLTQSVIQGMQSGQKVSPYAQQGVEKILTMYA